MPSNPNWLVKKPRFFGQSATAYFTALTTLANRKMEIGIPQRAVFPDAHLSKAYPGTKALLRVPRHTIQITGDFSKSFVQAVKKTMAKILSKSPYLEGRTRWFAPTFTY